MHQNCKAEDVNPRLTYLSLRGVRLRPSGQGLEFFIKFLDKPGDQAVDFSWFADRRESRDRWRISDEMPQITSIRWER
jgi:hypothetical protein